MADAKIFLSDCLACDSCVTVEEGVQLSQQSAKDFFHVLNLNKVWCQPELMVQACNSSYWETEAGDVQVQILPRLQTEFKTTLGNYNGRTFV